MVTNLSILNNESPFDSIRHYDENGNEFWLARELMVILGYSKWQSFGGYQENRLSVVDKAILACQNNGANSILNFTQTSKVVIRKGRGDVSQDDWKLTRYACYLVAMNGDPSKVEIAQAQSYFAVKTREAEVINLKPKTALELAKEQVKLLEQLEIQNQIIAAQEKDLLRQAEVIDELFNYSSILRVAKFNNCSETKFNWRRLKAISEQMKIEIKKVPSPRFEYQNLYSHDVWRYAYPDFNLPETTTLKVVF